jgi:hypothetical protein
MLGILALSWHLLDHLLLLILLARYRVSRTTVRQARTVSVAAFGEEAATARQIVRLIAAAADTRVGEIGQRIARAALTEGVDHRRALELLAHLAPRGMALPRRRAVDATT